MSQGAWAKAYVGKLDGRKPRCPECGKGPISWRLAGDPESRVGYAILWCEACRKGCHLSRVQFPGGVSFLPMSDGDDVVRGIPEIELVDDSRASSSGNEQAGRRKTSKS